MSRRAQLRDLMPCLSSAAWPLELRYSTSEDPLPYRFTCLLPGPLTPFLGQKPLTNPPTCDYLLSTSVTHVICPFAQSYPQPNLHSS